MKHFRSPVFHETVSRLKATPVDWTAMKGKWVPLEGKRVTKPEVLKDTFAKGFFLYQFVGSSIARISRIMRCSQVHELEWLMGEVGENNPLVIRPI